MWNLQDIIFIWRRRYLQIFQSELVYLFSESFFINLMKRMFVTVINMHKKQMLSMQKMYILGVRTEIC